VLADVCIVELDDNLMLELVEFKSAELLVSLDELVPEEFELFVAFE
jgi:hypothetical protein